MHSRLLLGAATIAALTLTDGRPAWACSPPDRAAPEEIGDVTIESEGHLPKNGALRFAIRAGTSLQELSRLTQRVRVSVTKGGDPVSGALRAIEGSYGTLGYYWTADGGGLPTGTLSVTVAYEARVGGDTTTRSQDVTVDDRVLAAPPPALEVKVIRIEMDDESAPAIQCTTKGGIGDCSGGRDKVSKIATRRVARPQVSYELTPPLSESDRRLIQIETDVFGRNKDGTTSPRVVSSVRVFEQPWDEYCVFATSYVLGETAKSENTVCASQPLDLAVSDEKTATWVKTQVAACDSVVYPPGTSAEDPTGTESGGCSAGRRSTTATSGVLVALLGLALVRGRRGRR